MIKYDNNIYDYAGLFIELKNSALFLVFFNLELAYKKIYKNYYSNLAIKNIEIK